MRLALGSDLHLECGFLDLDNTDNADVLILAGDILVAADINPKHEWFFENISKEFKNTIYISGNHEGYHGDFQKVNEQILTLLKPYSNIHYLHRGNEIKTIDDVTFIGSTLWTSMNNRDPIVMEYVNRCMNDFRIVQNGPDRIFNTKDAAREYEKTMERFTDLLDYFTPEDKVVMVTHHAPSYKSIHPRYQNDTMMNYGYHTPLDEFILDNPSIKLYIHGHVHSEFDYKIGDTRVVCHPRGYYGYELQAQNFKLKTVEV